MVEGASGVTTEGHVRESRYCAATTNIRAEGRIRSHASPCETRVIEVSLGQSFIQVRVSLSVRSISTPHSFIHVSSTLHNAAN
jgi:hypothetical protein